MLITISEKIDLHHGIITTKDGKRILLVRNLHGTYDGYLEPVRETLP